jgi:hypothetical protein
MSHKRILTLFLLISLTILCTSFQTNLAHASTWQIYIEPEISTAEPGSEFTVEMNIKDSPQLYTWVINVTWNPEILNFTGTTEGSFLNQEGSRKTDFIVGVHYIAGWAYIGCSLKGESSSAQPTGSGTLGYVTFVVLKAGDTGINITSTELFNYWTADPIDPTSYTTKNGSFKYPYFMASTNPKTTSDPNLTANKTFNMNITAFVQELYKFQINITWNNAVLEMVNATEGPFLTSGGNYSSNFTCSIFQTAGYALLNSTLLEPAAPANGTGTLATITFKVKTLGDSVIKLEKAEFYNKIGTEIPHGIVNGEFTNVIHDIAVLDITIPDITDNQITIGNVVNIKVTVKNKGNTPETVELKVTYGLLPIYTNSSINLIANETKLVTFSWDTSGLTKGSGELKAAVTHISGETFTSDNEKISETITLVEAAAGGFLPIEILIAIVVIIIVAVVAILIMRRRKK